MRRTLIITAILGGLLLIPGACSSPAAAIPPAPAPAPAPAAMQPPPATAPVPISTTPALAPGQAGFLAGAIRYIIQITPAPGQAGFLVSQLQVYPIEAAVGDNVTFSVVVTNTGRQTVTYAVALKFNDAVIQTRDVSIDGGGSKKVEFDVMAEYGEFHGGFEVVAGELTAGFRVFF